MKQETKTTPDCQSTLKSHITPLISHLILCINMPLEEFKTTLAGVKARIEGFNAALENHDRGTVLLSRRAAELQFVALKQLKSDIATLYNLCYRQISSDKTMPTYLFSQRDVALGLVSALEIRAGAMRRRTAALVQKLSLVSDFKSKKHSLNGIHGILTKLKSMKQATRGRPAKRNIFKGPTKPKLFKYPAKPKVSRGTGRASDFKTNDKPPSKTSIKSPAKTSVKYPANPNVAKGPCTAIVQHLLPFTEENWTTSWDRFTSRQDNICNGIKKLFAAVRTTRAQLAAIPVRTLTQVEVFYIRFLLSRLDVKMIQEFEQTIPNRLMNKLISWLHLAKEICQSTNSRVESGCKADGGERGRTTHRECDRGRRTRQTYSRLTRRLLCCVATQLANSRGSRTLCRRGIRKN